MHPKTPDEIYAQTAAFAHNQPPVIREQLSRQVGEIATTLLSNEPMVVQDIWRGDNHTLTPESYRDFLRSADPETRQDIRFLASRMTIQPEMEAALKGVVTGDKDSEHYLGSGSNGSAFRVTVNGEDFAAKKGGVTYESAQAFRRGDNIPGIAHLIAIDLHRNISVMNLVPGVLTNKVDEAVWTAIPRRHIEEVIDRVIEMNRAGINVDPKASNFLYDPDKGYGIIDYLPRGSEGELATQVLDLRYMLVTRDAGPIPKWGTPEYDAWHRTESAKSVARLGVLLDILETQHPDILAAAAAKQQEINSRPRTISPGFGDIASLPSGEPFDEFAHRVERLGLQGTTPRSYDAAI